MMRGPDEVAAAFRANLGELFPHEGRLLVAVSGGCDSVALLHLLRFAIPDLRLTAAHIDHAIRPDSAADASWLRGLCAAWGIPLTVHRLERAPTNEEHARKERYSFLFHTLRSLGGTHLATGHHADDQAETVLFRVLRGTGISGLRGIAPSDSRGLIRPLLPFWNDELVGYAQGAKLRWREDATNQAVVHSRNRIRLELLPWIERTVAPGARRSLVRLAEQAGEEEATWDAWIRSLEPDVLGAEGGAILLVRSQLAGYDTAVALRVLRDVLRRFGTVLGRTGTRAALQFITAAPSGREIRLPDGLRISTEFDLARIERIESPALPTADVPVIITGADTQVAGGMIAGRSLAACVRVREPGDSADVGDPSEVRLALARVRFPLTLRSRAPGDRMRTGSATKTLKQLFMEARLPRHARSRAPVLTDANGVVLWVGGVAQDPAFLPRAGEIELLLTIVDV